ncbi:unnamed protein product [Musa hybrid cultivar]
MVDSLATPIQPFHARSTSMPSRDHPYMLRVAEELQKVKSSVVQSSSTAYVICEGLRGIQGLYRCIEELLCLPSSNQIFSNPQQRKWVEVELDVSVRLLDLLGTLRDSTNSIKEQIRDLEMTLRRQGETVAHSKMQAYIRPEKKAEKDVKNCFRFLKQMDDKYALCFTDDKESDSWMLVRTLKEAREITISLLQSIFNFLSMPRPKTKTSRWSLISKTLHKRKVACEGEHADIEANDGRVQKAKARDQLQTVQNSFDGIEAGLECLFRSLVRNRRIPDPNTKLHISCSAELKPKAFQDCIVNMVDTPTKTIQPFHARSTSMPSGDHPFMLKVEEELQKVKSSVVQSSSTAHMICEGLRGIQGLYRCIEELLCLPSSNQIFVNPQQNKWVEVELEMSVRLLDLLGKLRDNMILIKEQIRDLEMTLRRRGEVVAQSKMQAYLHPDKKAEKDVKNCFRFLKQMDDKYALCCTDDKESNSWTVVRTLKAAREITVSLLQSILKFLCMPRPKTKTSRWSLISKALHKRKVACEGEHEDIEANDDGRVPKARDQLQILQKSIDEIEAGLECLFRSLVQNRVSLLNILSL